MASAFLDAQTWTCVGGPGWDGRRCKRHSQVGVICTIGKRCLELIRYRVCNKREWACVLMLDWIRLFVCLAVRPSTHLGRTGLDQTVCVFDSSNCHTVCVFCLIVCPPIGVGPDRISMEAPLAMEPRRWKKLRETKKRPAACSDMHRNWPTLSSKRLKGKQPATTVKAAPAKRSKRWSMGVLKRPLESRVSSSSSSPQFSQCLS